MKIKRGEIYLVNFNPSRGSEQAGKRPALIVQNDIGNEFSSTTIIVAISSNIRNNPTNILINPDKLNNIKAPSTIKTSQILTIDKERLLSKIGVLNNENLLKIDKYLRISLGL